VTSGCTLGIISSRGLKTLHEFAVLDTGLQDSIHTPPSLTAVDMEIARKNGSTLAIEAGRVSIQASKQRPLPNLSQMIKERTHQIIHLQQELLYLEKKLVAIEYLHQEVSVILVGLERALFDFQNLHSQSGHTPEYML
jgi:hypothetical protein